MYQQQKKPYLVGIVIEGVKHMALSRSVGQIDRGRTMADLQVIQWKINRKRPQIENIAPTRKSGSRNQMPGPEFSPKSDKTVHMNHAQWLYGKKCQKCCHIPHNFKHLIQNQHRWVLRL